MIKSRDLCVILLFCMILRGLTTMYLQFAFTAKTDALNYYNLTLLFQAAMYALLLILCIYQFKLSADTLVTIIGKLPNPINFSLGAFWGLTLFMFTAGENAFETWAISQFDADFAYGLWPFRTTVESSYGSISEYVAVLLISIIIAPATEEFFFRGLLFPALARRMKQHTAAILSSALFILIHYPHLHIVSSLVFSISLCYIYRTTRSVYLCAIVHSTFNLSVFLVESHWRSAFTRSAEQIHSYSVWLPQFALLFISTIIMCLVAYRFRSSITQT